MVVIHRTTMVPAIIGVCILFGMAAIPSIQMNRWSLSFWQQAAGQKQIDLAAPQSRHRRASIWLADKAIRDKNTDAAVELLADQQFCEFALQSPEWMGGPVARQLGHSIAGVDGIRRLSLAGRPCRYSRSTGRSGRRLRYLARGPSYAARSGNPAIGRFSTAA